MVQKNLRACVESLTLHQHQQAPPSITNGRSGVDRASLTHKILFAMKGGINML
jgi:hypothetical protein